MGMYTAEQVNEYIATYAHLESLDANSAVLYAPKLSASTLNHFTASLTKAQNVPEELRTERFQTALSRLETLLKHYTEDGIRTIPKQEQKPAQAGI